MRRTRRPAGAAVTAALVAGFVLTAGLHAAQRQTPTFRSTVDLVQVDVVVVDTAGNPVRGLKASDFTLLDRGKPQAIATFEEFSRADLPDIPLSALPPTVKRDVSSNQTAQAGRLVVMVVDDLHIFRGRTDRAKEIARQVVEDLGPQSSMAVLFTSGEHNTLVTEDRSILEAAIDTLKARQSWKRPHPAIDAQTGARIDPEMSAEAQLAIVTKNQDTKVQDFFDNMTQYKTLQDASRLLGGGDARRKAFILVSEGIGKDIHGLFGAMAPHGDVPEGGAEYAATGDATATMVTPPTSYHDVALVDMMEAMRRGNVSTYAIDPRGKVGSKDLLAECVPPPPGLVDDPCSSGFRWDSPLRQAQEGLQVLSEASGGFAVTDTDDFTGGLKKIVDDLDHYYLLGFYPADTKGKGYRPIGVRLEGHPGWKLRFRRGYMPGGAPSTAPKGASEMVALSAGILPKTDLPLRLSAIPLSAGTDGTQMALSLEVTEPTAALQDPDGKLRDTLKYEILVVDEKRAKVRSIVGLEGRLTLSPGGGEQPMPPSVSYGVEDAFDLAPGRYEVRVSATSAKLATGGSVYLDVDVPDLRSAPLWLGGLVVGYDGPARVPTAPPSARRPTPRLPFPPTLDRAFEPTDVLRVYAEIGAKEAGDVTSALHVLDASGRIVSTPSASLSGSPVHLDARVPLVDLAPGGYVLLATLSDGVHTVTRETGVVVK